MHRLTMIEHTEVSAVDCDLVLIHLDQHQHVERLSIADRTTPVAFLSAPDLVLKRVSHDHCLIRANTNVQRDVIAWIQRGSRLYIDLTPFSVVVDDAFYAHHRPVTKAAWDETQKGNHG